MHLYDEQRVLLGGTYRRGDVVRLTAPADTDAAFTVVDLADFGDFVRGNAWRYRDYVVRAFNADKPYDQFMREQIAGDEIAPDNPEAVIATGFLRMGPWELTSMEVPKVARQKFLDDVTDSVAPPAC